MGGITCEKLVSDPGGVNDSHLINTIETGDMHDSSGKLRLALQLYLNHNNSNLKMLLSIDKCIQIYTYIKSFTS